MARPVKIRACYRTDSAFLIRLEDAISKDLALPEQHRVKMMEMAHELSMLCMVADKLRKSPRGQ